MSANWTYEEARNAVDSASNLDDLCEALNAHPEYEEEGGIKTNIGECVDMASLPTFGGEEPSDTSGIWSWDQDRLLVSDADGGFSIVNREDW